VCSSDLAENTNFTISISGAATGFFEIVPYNRVIPGFPVLTDDLTNMMGLTPTALPGLPYYKTYDGGFASMMRTPFIDIVSNLLTKNQNVRDNDSTKAGASSVLARVYLSSTEATPRIITITYDGAGNAIDFTDNAFGIKETTFRREFQFPKQVQWNTTENIDVIDLRVLDYKSNILSYVPCSKLSI
jgi:hypothetical protein